MKIVLSAACFLACFNLFAKKDVEFATRCIGDKDASKKAIFLHGMLPVNTLSKGAYGSEAHLAKVAKQNGYQIAVPRSHHVCQRDRNFHCWGETKNIEATYQAILKSASKCFDTSKPFVAIGFSDGGYHLGRVFMKKIAPQPSLTIAIGSAGNITYAGSNDLTTSSRFTLLSGKSDTVLSDAKAFVSALKKKGAQVDFRTYDGGHEIPFELLGTVLAHS